MLLACEIEFADGANPQFVLFRNALYLLPDETLAKASSQLIWCFGCDSFQDGESIPTTTELQTLVAECETESLQCPNDVLFDTPEKINRYREELRRSLHWLSFRTSSPKCLQCGSENIQAIETPLGVFTDPYERDFTLSHVFASTTIDHTLFVYDADGRQRGEMSLICPDSSEFIDDAYPPNLLVKLLNQSSIAG